MICNSSPKNVEVFQNIITLNVFFYVTLTHNTSVPFNINVNNMRILYAKRIQLIPLPRNYTDRIYLKVWTNTLWKPSWILHLLAIANPSVWSDCLHSFGVIVPDCLMQCSVLYKALLEYWYTNIQNLKLYLIRKQTF